MEKSLDERILNRLRESNLVDVKRLDKALEELRQGGEARTISVLIDSGIVSDRDILTILSLELGIPPLDLSRVNTDVKVMGLIPEKLARRYCVVPLSRIGNELTLAIADPTDIFAIDDIKTVTGCNVELVLTTRKSLEETLRLFYKVEEEEISEIMSGGKSAELEVVEAGERLDVVEITKESTAAPIVKMVDLIIGEAIRRRSSDIHVEPQETSLRIRYRIDGELHTVFDLPKKNQNAVLARLKIMSNLDITETRVPQDGRFRIKLGDKEIDFRVSSLPINYGNKIVLRALDKSNLQVGIDTLGFLPEPLADFKRALERPFGIILVTGPTGSGKSTTLYSIINAINTPERNIITVEDPVEYQLQGITQIPVRPEIGLDFADGLKAILRQSPDVIMVGEIRDFETADIAIKASLTGQMVFSTLHTNDAVGAITRLENMGIEPFLIASSLVLTSAQRLLRRICPVCKQEAMIPEEVLRGIREKYPEAREVKTFYQGKGCAKCNGTGYYGRMGTLETVLIDNEIREMVNRRRSEEDIKSYLKSKGIRTLRDNSMINFIKGLTTLEEVLRVT